MFLLLAGGVGWAPLISNAVEPSRVRFHSSILEYILRLNIRIINN